MHASYLRQTYFDMPIHEFWCFNKTYFCILMCFDNIVFPFEKQSFGKYGFWFSTKLLSHNNGLKF